MDTLGINAVYHDPAACLVRDGEIIAAAEEERFTHVKHGKRPIPFSTYELPFHAIDYCLREAGITLCDLDHVAYSYNPSLLPGKHYREGKIELPLMPERLTDMSDFESPWDPLFLCEIMNAPGQLRDGAPHHLQARFRGARQDHHFEWHWVTHHIAHAASAFHASPFARAAVMTLDGRGEQATTAYALGEGNQLEMLAQVNMPHSLGILYELVTEYLGFLHSSDEYKVMALAAFGQPRFEQAFREIVQLHGAGQYTIGPTHFEDRFGPARVKGGPLDKRHYDIACSLQRVLEDTAIELANWLYRESRADQLCMAGGVALNCLMNSQIRDRGPFDEVWVQPAAGDAGTALGAALWIDAQQRQTNSRGTPMNHALLGPAFGEEEIEDFLRWSKLPYRRLDNVPEQTAGLLVADKVIGWFQGRMEFGPRALGARSILASPIHPEMQARLNDIKDREDFRPVAPVVIEDRAGQWFSGCRQAPFMLFVFDILPDRIDRIPAVSHIDGTARVQTVNRSHNPLYYDLLSAFERRTGVPVLVNTSFNTRGEPIVCTPRDAIESFWTSPLDALVIGPFLLEKAESPAHEPASQAKDFA